MPVPNILTWTNQAVDLSPVVGFQVPYRGIVSSDGSSGVYPQAQVVVSEDGDDDLQITEHPVEQGSLISDHAFKRPCELRVQLGWSDAYADAYAQTVNSIYQQILNLQANRVPFTVYTAKRTYQNMLVASVRVHTDARTAFNFIADIQFKEVILVATSVLAVVGATLSQIGALADPADYSEVSLGAQNGIPTITNSTQATTAAT